MTNPVGTALPFHLRLSKNKHEWIGKPEPARRRRRWLLSRFFLIHSVPFSSQSLSALYPFPKEHILIEVPSGDCFLCPANTKGAAKCKQHARSRLGRPTQAWSVGKTYFWHANGVSCKLLSSMIDVLLLRQSKSNRTRLSFEFSNVIHPWNPIWDWEHGKKSCMLKAKDLQRGTRTSPS